MISLITGAILITILIIVKITMSSSGGGDKGDHGCVAPNKYFPQYNKCLYCDPKDSKCGKCSNDSDCKNSTKCFKPIDGNQGVCICEGPKPINLLSQLISSLIIHNKLFH